MALDARTAAILDACPLPMGVHDDALRILFVNSAFRDTFGYTSDDIPDLGTWWRAAYPDGEYRDRISAEWTAEVERARAAGDRFNPIEGTIRCKDGTVRTALVTAEPIFDTLEGLHLVALFDITERKQAEAERHADHERYRAILQSSMDGFLIADETGRVVEVNGAYLEMTGLSREQVLGRSVYDLEPIPDRASLEPRMTALRTSGSARFDTRHHHRDGSLIDVEVSVRVDPSSGWYVAFVRDIRERLQGEKERARLEAELRQASKMESVGRLAGGVAHDFNNMLGVITGHIDLALDEIDPASPLAEDLHVVRRAAARSAELTRQLLAFARKQPMTRRVVDLGEAVGGMLKMLGRLMGENIRIEFEKTPGLWPLHVDPAQIDQILANLCVNARDAITDVGLVTLSTTNVTADEAFCATRRGLTTGDYVRLSVRDNGSGMDEATLAHLFEPFFTTKPLGAGTGLGLATVYGIVKQNHGYIEVESAVGQGAAFHVYLPRHEGPAGEVQEPASQPTGGHETVLVVEDEVGILRITVRILAELGYTVLAAASPKDALAIAQERGDTLELVITDVVMPEMSGRVLAERLGEARSGLRVLYMTGYSSDQDAEALALDPSSVLRKPFTRRELARAVRTVLDAPARNA